MIKRFPLNLVKLSYHAQLICCLVFVVLLLEKNIQKIIINLFNNSETLKNRKTTSENYLNNY